MLEKGVCSTDPGDFAEHLMALSMCTSYKALCLGSRSFSVLHSVVLRLDGETTFLLGHLVCIRVHQEETQEGDCRAGEEEGTPSCPRPTPVGTSSHGAALFPPGASAEPSGQFFHHLQDQLHHTPASETPASAQIWGLAPKIPPPSSATPAPQGLPSGFCVFLIPHPSLVLPVLEVVAAPCSYFFWAFQCTLCHFS